MELAIYSKVTGFPVYVVLPSCGGYIWNLNWRYNKTSKVFSSAKAAIADAQEDYNDLREKTAIVHHGRRGDFKEYII